ncbi:MAG TPA: phosphatase PAP2 family protein [Lysobacter sp.]
MHHAIGPTASHLRLLALGIVVAATLGACATSPSADTAANATTSAPPPATPVSVAQAVPEIRPGILAGYLGRDLPDSLKLLPPPPAEGSAAFKNDQAVSRASQKLRGTPRYELARSDADLAFPHAAGVFACALGVPVTQERSPQLYLLLRRVLTDAALATYGAKDHYKRTRPFVHYRETTCLPRDEESLRKDGSYPSGHTSIGWAWALVLTQVAPDRADALLARGRSYGESRLVCNAHWQSDILQGRPTGAGAVAKLQSNATFQADVAAARKEIAALRASGATPQVDCAAEAAALAIPIPGVQ